jgi:tRNA pseudouridine38-40 synthase
MVRNIVGTLVEVGLGRRNPSEMKEILDSCDRNIAGVTAPARGLYLKEVKY